MLTGKRASPREQPAETYQRLSAGIKGRRNFMQLLIKQRVFSWTDKYDIYDGNGDVRYFVKGEFLSLGHRLRIYDASGNEVGLVKQKLLTILPVFELEQNGQVIGRVERRFTMFKPKYDVDFRGWRAEGDFLQWNYEVWQACSMVMRITKKLLSWGDTYVLDIADPADELHGLMLALAIDAANCSNVSVVVNNM